MCVCVCLPLVPCWEELLQQTGGRVLPFGGLRGKFVVRGATEASCDCVGDGVSISKSWYYWRPFCYPCYRSEDFFGCLRRARHSLDLLWAGHEESAVV